MAPVRRDRRRLLLIVMAVLTAMNIGSALAPEFVAIAAIRFVGGLFAALTCRWRPVSL